MHKAARGDAAISLSPFASIERALDGAMASLAKAAPTVETQALTVEARRLRSVVSSWRRLPPPPDLQDEMLDRVLQLSAQTSAVVDPGAQGRFESEPPPLLEAAKRPAARPQTEAYALASSPRRRARDQRPEASPAKPMGAAYPPSRELPREPRPPAQAAYPAAPENYGYAPAAEPQRAYPPYPRSQPEAPFTRAPVASPYPPEAVYAREGSYPPPPLLSSPPSPLHADYPYPEPPRPGYPGPPHAEYSPPQATYPAAPTPPSPPIYAITKTQPPPAAPADTRPVDTWQEEADEDEDLEPEEATLVFAPASAVVVHATKLPAKVDEQLVLICDTYSVRADIYRALRRKLAASSNPHVIAITSPNAGEGKTTCAINLALTLREGGHARVLLLEANLRTPRIARLLGFAPPACFGEQLLRHHEDPLRPWVVVEPMPQLHVMAVDPEIEHPPLLDPVAFADGIERLKGIGYEFIVIDTPPVLGSFEVNMISDAVDGVLITAITMKSKKSAIKKAIEQLLPAPILGAVVLEA